MTFTFKELANARRDRKQTKLTPRNRNRATQRLRHAAKMAGMTTGMAKFCTALAMGKK